MRLLQIGLGGFGRSWAELARRADGIDYLGAVDPDPAARAWAERNLGMPAGSLYPSLADALDAADFEAVLLATPPATHHPVGLAALGAGKHVLVEKPLATTLPDAQELVAAAATANRILAANAPEELEEE